MSEIKNKIFLRAMKSPMEGLDLLGKLAQVASPEAVFSEPIKEGEYTVITANEISVGLGFGVGGGVDLAEAEETVDDETVEPVQGSVGSGGGGGGSTLVRPVAVIEIGPDGVRVEPIVDVTKICIVFFTAFGAVFAALRKIKRVAK
jgi:uncharacterized spore protein YtfJ